MSGVHGKETWGTPVSGAAVWVWGAMPEVGLEVEAGGTGTKGEVTHLNRKAISLATVGGHT